MEIDLWLVDHDEACAVRTGNVREELTPYLEADTDPIQFPLNPVAALDAEHDRVWIQSGSDLWR